VAARQPGRAHHRRVGVARVVGRGERARSKGGAWDVVGGGKLGRSVAWSSDAARCVGGWASKED
jgi:hypothetical protein